MTDALPPRNRRTRDPSRAPRGDDTLGIVLRALALAALALGLGIGASLLVDARNMGHPVVGSARR